MPCAYARELNIPHMTLGLQIIFGVPTNAYFALHPRISLFLGRVSCWQSLWNSYTLPGIVPVWRLVLFRIANGSYKLIQRKLQTDSGLRMQGVGVKSKKR